MEKDIGRIPKGMDTEIVIRIDDFGGRVGLTIREFVRSERYSGFTKAGTRIPADKFKQFKEMINSIDEKELENLSAQTTPQSSSLPSASGQSTFAKPASKSVSVDKKPVNAKAEPVEEIEEQEF